MDINDRISQYRQDIKSDRVDMSFGEIINGELLNLSFARKSPFYILTLLSDRITLYFGSFVFR